VRTRRRPTGAAEMGPPERLFLLIATSESYAQFTWRCDTSKATEMKTALLMTIFIATAGPVLANPYRTYQYPNQMRWDDSSHINCETVRAYVSQVGLVQARALARAAGMTAGQEWRARRCLAKKDGQ
jgi:hypothetical protein